MLFITCTITAYAGSDAAREHFQTGRAAFEAQNYAAALEAFEAALAAGLSGPAVQFNIGVIAFRLERYSRAQDAFEEAARTPQMAALAHYNLGLVTLRRGDREAATRWFSLAEQEAGDERLRGLAAAQLGELLPTIPADRSWVGYAALAAGYDDNVALISSSDVLGVSGTEDSFAELQLALSTAFDSPWRLDASLFLVDYQELDSFDQLSIQSGGRYRYVAGDWTNEVGLQLARTTLDGEGLENQRMLVLQTSTAPLPGWRARARYRYSDIDGLEDFRGLSGHRHEMSADLGRDLGPWNLRLEYRFDLSDHDDESLSARRQQLGIDLSRSLREHWSLALEAARRHSKYDLQSNGTENHTELSVAVHRDLGTRWRLIMRYAYADNDADRAEFNYQRNRISAGIEALL